jgi:HSP20 family protein
MNLIRNTELPELSWLRNELNRLGDFWRPLDLADGGEGLSAWAPAVDIEEDEKAITIKADLPDVEKKDIHVKVENGTLTISGERKREKEEKKKNYHRIERSYGSYMRSFALPESIDRDKIAAECKNGVLTLTLPKRADAVAKAKAAEIPVK